MSGVGASVSSTGALSVSGGAWSGGALSVSGGWQVSGSVEFGGVAVTSLVVHASVMTHTAWVSNFWNGGAAKTAAVDTNIAPVASNVTKTADGYVITVNVTPGASSLDGAELAAK